MLSRREPAEAGVTVRPHMSKAGPRMPPKGTIDASQGRSRARSGASERPRPSGRPPAATKARPAPEPRYSNPASSSGSAMPRSSFAIGVLAPNRNADLRASTGAL